MPKSSGRWQETFLSWFMAIGIPYALVWLGLVVLPTYHTEFSLIICFHVFLGLYLVLIILINFNKVVNMDISVKPAPSIHDKDTDLPFCTECQVHQPPRSFHCSTCNQCIDKRDHHCLFTGCCVGGRNHGHFVCGVVAVFIGSVYGVIYEWDMVVAAAGGYSAWLPLQLSAPHLLWPFGLLDSWGLLVCIHNMLGMSVLVNAGVLVYLQLSALWLGQTQFERRRGVTRFDRGWRQNVRHVLGERWLAALVWPLADSPLPSTEDETEDGSTNHDKSDIGGAAGHESCDGRDASAGQDQKLTRRNVDCVGMH